MGRIKEYIYGVLPGHFFIKTLISSKRLLFERLNCPNSAQTRTNRRVSLSQAAPSPKSNRGTLWQSAHRVFLETEHFLPCLRCVCCDSRSKFEGRDRLKSCDTERLGYFLTLITKAVCLNYLSICLPRHCKVMFPKTIWMYFYIRVGKSPFTTLGKRDWTDPLSIKFRTDKYIIFTAIIFYY